MLENPIFLLLQNWIAASYHIFSVDISLAEMGVEGWGASAFSIRSGTLQIMACWSSPFVEVLCAPVGHVVVISMLVMCAARERRSVKRVRWPARSECFADRLQSSIGRWLLLVNNPATRHYFKQKSSWNLIFLLRGDLNGTREQITPWRAGFLLFFQTVITESHCFCVVDEVALLCSSSVKFQIYFFTFPVLPSAFRRGCL